MPPSDAEFRNIDVVKWAQDLATLKELMDSREVVAYQRINENRLAEALDVCAQRVKAKRMAKAPKGAGRSLRQSSSSQCHSDLAGKRVRRSIGREQDFVHLAHSVVGARALVRSWCGWIRASLSQVGIVLREFEGVPLNSRVSGQAESELSPVPLVPLGRLPRLGRGRERAHPRRDVSLRLNASLNVMYGFFCASLTLASQAEIRLIESVRGRLRSFLHDVGSGPICGAAIMNEGVHADSNPYEPFACVLPFDDRAGVPVHAGALDTARVLGSVDLVGRPCSRASASSLEHLGEVRLPLSL